MERARKTLGWQPYWRLGVRPTAHQPPLPTPTMEETKIIYHIDDEETPYLVKIPKAPDKVTLSDFKNVLNRPSYKFFFKSMDDDFG